MGKVNYGKLGAKNKQVMDKQSGAVQEEPEVKENQQPVEPTPSKVATKDKPGAQRGLPDGWTRFTVTVPIELAEDMKDLAYTERLKLKDVVVRAFEDALKDVELIHRPDRKN